MRFDDTLETVLAADLSSDAGRQSAFRQLVDLVGRRRVAADPRPIAAIAELAPQVPLATREACARGLAFADPPEALVGLFAADTLSVAAPVLRTARLSGEAWGALIPTLGPGARAILRHRRDLPDAAVRALESFGPADFVLGDDRPVEAVEPAPAEVVAEPIPFARPAPSPGVRGPFASFGTVALGLPVVAEAVRLRERPAAANQPEPDGPFAIADVVARIDAYRERSGQPRDAASPAVPDADPDRFRFEVDADGVVRRADGVGRDILIGMSLLLAGKVGMAAIDGVAAGAFRQRARFRDARLTIDAGPRASGAWLLSGIPHFDPATGRFTGYRGTARRAHAGELAGPVGRAAAPDSIRQLVHELRTPVNAVIGFSEMIGMEVLGPVPEPYRAHADSIRQHARDLLAAIDDLDLAARIESEALSLRPETVSLRAVLGVVADDLRPLCEVRGTGFDLPQADAAVDGDRHAVERLLGRLLATLVSATRAGERIGMTLTNRDGEMVLLAIDRPAALRLDDAADDGDAAIADAVPLGAAFALRLATNLARELGGALDPDGDRLLLTLPAAAGADRQRATKS